MCKGVAPALLLDVFFIDSNGIGAKAILLQADKHSTSQMTYAQWKSGAKYLAVFGIGLAIGPADVLAPIGAAKLVPHRAVYEMTLDDNRPSSGISAVQGRMVFDFAGSGCDGYTMNMRMVTRVLAQSGRSSISDLRTSTWEHGDGKLYRFNTSHYLGRSLEESTSGDAKRADGDGHVDVRISAPQEKIIKVAGPVLFPTQHSLEILAAARMGKKLLQARVYDGSSKGDKVYSTTTFIGKRLAPGVKRPAKRVANDKMLDALDSWRVSISYFESADNIKELPAYQLNFRLYDNGISRELQIDYGDFVIKGELSSLEIRPLAECE